MITLSKLIFAIIWLSACAIAVIVLSPVLLIFAIAGLPEIVKNNTK